MTVVVVVVVLTLVVVVVGSSGATRNALTWGLLTDSARLSHGSPGNGLDGDGTKLFCI